MRITLGDILSEIGGYVDQDTTLPTGTDLTVRINYVNRALQEWAKQYDWDELTIKHNPTAATASAQSLGLPTNFKKPMSALYHYNTAKVPEEYEIIARDEAYQLDPTNYFSYVDGNTVRGFALVVPRGLPSGASLAIDIQVFPSALATTTDYAEIPDPQFLTTRAIAYVLESRADSRFPFVRDDAKTILANMVENQNARNKGMLNQIPRRKGFVIGRGR